MKLFATLLLAFSTVSAMAGNYTKYVNPFIGTGAVENSLSGNCYPGATVPFGLVQLSPDTREVPNWDCAPGYDYNDHQIYGFSHTHLSGTGVSDLIDLMLMPTTENGTNAPKSDFNHNNEEAQPGYYRVNLTTYNILAELSATTHVGIHRYTFPQESTQRLFIDLDHSAKKGDWDRRIIQAQICIVSPTVIEGFRVITGWAKLRKVYFHIELSRPIISHILIDGGRQESNASVINGSNLKAFLDFGNKGNQLIAKVALSPVSVANARENMKAEATSWDFQTYRDNADSKWDKMLGKIEVNGKKEDMTVFYTALYHALIQPNTMSDVNGEYMAPDYSINRMEDGHSYYSTFSLWDTYRAAHPLYNLIFPLQNDDFIRSMMRHYKAYGYLPIWSLWGQENYCMIGNHSIPVLANAILTGTTKLNSEELFQAMVASATISHPNSPFEVWEKYGYMPEDKQSQSVSITLEQSYDDWCIAQVANKLGKADIYKHFIRRSEFYHNLYNPATGFFQAKNSDGKWLTPFDPLKYGANGGNPYTEGNAWQYYWYVPQNVDGLIKLTGGKKAFIKKLDTFFTLTEQSGQKNDNASGFIGQYVHGNEPSHHVAYLYALAGEPRKTQELVNRIERSFYNTSSSGYAGNDDCGEMSTWFVLSSLGFYPVNPASGDFVLGAPLFSKAILHLPNGKTFTINSNRSSDNDIYVAKRQLNGKTIKLPTISFTQIMNGGQMNVDMTKK